MGFCIVHAADLHIDSPLRGLSRYEGAPVAELRGATRRALSNLVSLCLEEQAKLLLIAGDLYDGEWRDYSTGLFLSAQLARLREVGTQVVWIRGNHDAESRLTKHLVLGDHVHELGAKRPETRVFDALGIAVHGQGFATAAVTDDLSVHYPPPLVGALNIGLLHTALSGRAGHAPYAPCEIRTLENKGYDYWALGHVHAREVVREAPYIVFPGNLQARHVRETGAKGATLIHVDAGVITRLEHRALDVVRFAHARVDVSAVDHVDDVIALCRRAMLEAVAQSEQRLCALRLSLCGKTRAHAALMQDPERVRAAIKARSHELSTGDVWIEDILFSTEIPLDLASLRTRDDAVGQLVRQLSAMREDPVQFAAFMAELAELETLLPHDVRSSELGLDLRDPEQARGLIDSVEQLLLPRLFDEAP